MEKETNTNKRSHAQERSSEQDAKKQKQNDCQRSSCKQILSPIAFSKKQRKKGTSAKCVDCMKASMPTVDKTLFRCGACLQMKTLRKHQRAAVPLGRCTECLKNINQLIKLLKSVMTRLWSSVPSATKQKPKFSLPSGMVPRSNARTDVKKQYEVNEKRNRNFSSKRKRWIS